MYLVPDKHCPGSPESPSARTRLRMGRSPISWVSGSWSSSCVGSLTLRTGLDYRVYRWPLPKSYYQSHRQSLCSKVPYHSGCHCVVRLVKVTMIVSSPRPIPPCSISCTLARLAVLPCLARYQSVMRSLMNLIFDRIRPPRIAIVMHRPGGTVGSGQCHCRRSHDSARQHAQISPTLSLSLWLPQSSLSRPMLHFCPSTGSPCLGPPFALFSPLGPGLFGQHDPRDGPRCLRTYSRSLMTNRASDPYSLQSRILP